LVVGKGKNDYRVKQRWGRREWGRGKTITGLSKGGEGRREYLLKLDEGTCG